MNQLPAHLQNRQVRSLVDRASEGMGSSLPPHISIKGNAFTFIDAAGSAYNPVPAFAGVIVDIADVMGKRYYGAKWTPNSDSPPDCWSTNGIGPSIEAVAPQAERCDICPHNVRGSKISELSGAAIKACRDEKAIAVLIPQAKMIFQMVITPGSFGNWKAYTETLRNYRIEPSFVLTQFSFKPGVNGELLFGQGDYVDEATIDLVEASNKEGKTDAMVGRLDRPRPAALAAPAGQPQIAAPAVAQPNASFLPAAPPTDTAGAAAASPQPAVAAEPAPRRRGRPAAVQQPAQASVQPASAAPPFVPAAGGGIPPFLQRQAPQTAPQGSSNGATPANNFGISPGAPVNPEMSAMLKDLFKPA